MALDAAITNIIGDRKIGLAILLELVFPSETLRTWSGTGSLSWNSKTWVSDNIIRGFDKIATDLDQNENQVTFRMGFDPSRAMMQDIRDGNGQDGDANIYLLFLDTDTGAPLADEPLLVGFIDSAKLSLAQKELVADVTLSSETSLLRRTTNHNLTDGAQQFIFPGDRGLEYATNPFDTKFGSGSTGSSFGSGSAGGFINSQRTLSDFL